MIIDSKSFSFPVYTHTTHLTTGGVAVIMTSKDKQGQYESMSTGQELVESQLPKRFHEGM